MTDPLATRTNDGLDELMVGVFVAAVDQFPESLTAMRSIVERAAKIKRPDRVVRRPDREHPHAGGGGRGVAEDGGFGRLQQLAEPGASVEARRRQRVWAGRFRRGGHQDDLLDTEVDQLVDDANQPAGAV